MESNIVQNGPILTDDNGLYYFEVPGIPENDTSYHDPNIPVKLPSRVSFNFKPIPVRCIYAYCHIVPLCITFVFCLLVLLMDNKHESTIYLHAQLLQCYSKSDSLQLFYR